VIVEGRGFEVAPGLHRIEAPLGERYVACYLVVGSRDALLVDTGAATSPAGSILPYAASIGLAAARIRWAVVTHCDVDHMGGDAALVAAVPDAILVAGEADRRLIEDVGALVGERYREFAADHEVDIDAATIAWCHEVAEAAPVGLAIEGSMTVELGGRRVRIFPTPGHSRGSISAWDETTGAAMTSDAVLGSTLHFADGRPAFPPTYRYPAAYRATIADLERLDPAWLLTAHEPVMDRAGARAFLAESRGYADRLEAGALRELAGAGAAGSTTRQLIDRLAPEMGSWDRSAWPLLANELVGHLEELAAAGAIGTRPGPPVTWVIGTGGRG
jgi:glyoxylase-like metal-dependent hydrolase (beta-lactamase superfamily II)